MPFRHLPDTHAQRLAAMKNAADKLYLATAEADRLITTAQFTAIDLSNGRSLHSVFKRDAGESAAALAQQADLTGEHDIAIGALGQVVSQFIQTAPRAGMGRRACAL